MQNEAIYNTSILSGALWLRFYDQYPLICSDRQFSLDYAKALIHSQLPCSLVPTPTNTSLTVLFLDIKENEEQYKAIIKKCAPKLLQVMRCPYLVKQAEDKMTDSKDQPSGCPLEAPLNDVCQQMVHAWETQQISEFKLYMHPNLRLRVLKQLLHRMTQSSLERQGYVPDLLRVFLYHCNARDLSVRYNHYNQEPLQTVVSGIWTGLSVRPSAAMPRLSSVPAVTPTTMLIALYTDIMRELFHRGAKAEYVDGMLFGSLSLLLSSKEEKEFKKRDLLALDKPTGHPLRATYAAVRERNEQIHKYLSDHIRYLRDILNGASSSIPMDFAHALRTAFRVEQLLESSDYKDCVKESKICWDWREVKLINPDDIRKILVEHDAVSQLQDLEALLLERQDKKQELVYLCIQNATAYSVFSALEKVCPVATIFLAEYFDIDQYKTLLVMQKEHLWGFQRWSAIQVTEEKLQEASHDIVPSQIFPCPAAALVCQLWASPRPFHRNLAFHILRKWTNLCTNELVTTEDISLQYLYKKIEELLGVFAIPSTSNSRKMPFSIAEALPYMLCYDVGRDQLNIPPETMKNIEDSYNGTSELTAPIPSRAMSRLYLFYTANSSDPRVRSETANQHKDRGKHKFYFIFLDVITSVLKDKDFTTKDVTEFLHAFRYKTAQGTWNSETKRTRPTPPVRSMTTNAIHPYSPYNVQNQIRRAKPALDTVSECKSYCQQAWQLFAYMEQQQLQEVVFPIPDLMDPKHCLYKHQCLRLFDVPVAYTTNDQQSTDIYCSTNFAIRVARPVDNPKLDICPRLRFIQLLFQQSITEEFLQSFNKQLQIEVESGYLMDLLLATGNTNTARFENERDNLLAVLQTTHATEPMEQDPVVPSSSSSSSPTASETKEPTPTPISSKKRKSAATNLEQTPQPSQRSKPSIRDEPRSQIHINHLIIVDSDFGYGTMSSEHQEGDSD